MKIDPVELAVISLLTTRCKALGFQDTPGPHTAVFEEGLLDSLSLIELVAAVEGATGQTVDMLRFDPAAVQSTADLVAELSAALTP